ncbi:hypothetical protein SDC9_160715 [bioreactor metagenome]|uniref:Uncharacterized protein n=1 Tax=bioreactor metagenome TaxID=1076179 RepID=A0A645FLV9_9ZZZZ
MSGGVFIIEKTLVPITAANKKGTTKLIEFITPFIPVNTVNAVRTAINILPITPGKFSCWVNNAPVPAIIAENDPNKNMVIM